MKVGDEVELVTLMNPCGLSYRESRSNTVGNIGKIISVSIYIQVLWDNDTANTYVEECLALTSEEPSTVNTQDE